MLDFTPDEKRAIMLVAATRQETLEECVNHLLREALKPKLNEGFCACGGRIGNDGVCERSVAR